MPPRFGSVRQAAENFPVNVFVETAQFALERLFHLMFGHDIKKGLRIFSNHRFDDGDD